MRPRELEEDTIFDKILRKEIPCSSIYEDDDVLAFSDINPQAPIHVLVIPKRKITSFDAFCEADAEFVGRYIKKVAHVAKHLGLAKEGYRIVFNHGENGAQTVNYIHAHILGERQLGWPPG